MAKKKLNKKLIRNIAIAVGVVIFAGVAGLLLSLWRGAIFNDKANEPAPLTDAAFLPTKVNEARELEAQGKIDEANQKLEQALKTGNNDEKYEYHLQLGLNYRKQKQYDKAITTYQQAAKIKETEAAYYGLGAAAEAKGDKALAVESYKKALPLLDTSSPMYEGDKSNLEALIKELGG